MQSNIFQFFKAENYTDQLLRENRELKYVNQKLKEELALMKAKVVNYERILANGDQPENAPSRDVSMIIVDDDEDKPHRKKAATYTMRQKYRYIIMYDEGKSARDIEKETGVNHASIVDWVKDRNQILEMILCGKGDSLRLTGAGRKSQLPLMENYIYDWICEERGKNNLITYRRLLETAKKMCDHSEFAFSKGWLYNFMNRYKLSYRKRNSSSFINLHVIDLALQNFYPELFQHLFKNPHITQFFNFDETRVELDMVTSRTIDFIGNKNVVINTTNSENKAYTVVLGAFSDGRKIPPLILFNGIGTRITKELQKVECNVDYVFTGNDTSSFQNAKTLQYWWDNTFSKNTSEEDKAKTLVFLDNCGKVHKCYQPEYANLYFFPVNTTSKLQPMDVGVNKIFKDRIRYRWENWMAQNGDNYTNSGYRKAVDREEFMFWVEDAWNMVTPEHIISSFKHIHDGLAKFEDEIDLN
jgi:hypothetical protein